MSETTVDIKTYISDMIAVEHHILRPVEKQLDTDKFEQMLNVKAVLEKTQRVLKNHIDILENHLETLGGHPASGIKTAVGEVLGVAASAVQDIRPTKVSKGLRDDHTALSLASVSYEMLYTTALAARASETAEIALDNLKDIVAIIMELTGTITDVVTQELLEIDPSLDSSITMKAKEDIYGSWSSHPAAGV